MHRIAVTPADQLRGLVVTANIGTNATGEIIDGGEDAARQEIALDLRPVELPVNQLPPSLADFGRRLLEHEVGNSESAGDLVAAFERACQALHSRMAPLISPAGFGALIERAVKLAARDFPFLGGTNAPVAANCSVDGLRHVAEGREPAEVADALAAILANFIWLVVIFIGENLGLRKVREVWPNVPFAAPGSSPEKAPQ